MKTGIVFDIKEFAIHDGPGLRTTVFMKGCPLDCAWCHNPEGKSCAPQMMKTTTSQRMVGKDFTSAELSQRLNRHVDIHRLNGGGVTFSGGEPLMQTEFLVEVIDQLENNHILIDTSGYGDPGDFLRLISRSDMVYFDLKIIDQLQFREFTGGDIQVVLDNLGTLSKSNTPFVIRVPLVPGVTDTEENLTDIRNTIMGFPGIIRLDLLPYNPMAGSKYQTFGMEFQAKFNENITEKVYIKIFEGIKIPWRVA